MRQFFIRLLCGVLLIGSVPACAQFTTIINVPPNIFLTDVPSGTQLNVFDGGVLFFETFISNGGELNLFGGNASQGIFALGGGTLNISGGNVGNQFSGSIQADGGSIVNISGGNVFS